MHADRTWRGRRGLLYNIALKNRFKRLRDANSDLQKLCEEHDTSYERRRLEMQQYR